MPERRARSWATAVSAGPGETGQVLTFNTSNDNSALFSAQPALSPAGDLTFTPAADAYGSAIVTVTLKDDGGTANSGVDTSASQTFTIFVTPVNDPPVAGDDSGQSTAEDIALTIASSVLTANDSPGPNEATQTLSAEVVLGSGSNGTVSQAGGIGGLITFTPAANFHGAASFRYKVWDDDGSNPLSDEGVVNVTVTSVNDPPAGADNTIAIHSAARTMVAGDFGFDDSADVPVNNFSAIKVTSLPTAGTLKLNGAAVTAGAFVTAADINLGLLVFEPAAGASGIPYATFTFQVQDDGGTSNTGVDLDQSPNTMVIIVWKLTTSADCGVSAPPEIPDVAVSGNAILLGTPVGDTSMTNCIHGASAVLAHMAVRDTKYQVTFEYNLFTWDSYNAVAGSGTGYFDSFSVSVSSTPYQSLVGLTRPDYDHQPAGPRLHLGRH